MGNLMLKTKIAIITFTILICTISSFAKVNLESSQKIQPMPSARQAGDLGLLIVASDSPKFVEEWVKTPPKHAPRIKRIFSAKPDQLIVSAFLVTGLSANESGQFSFSVSFYVLAPNGKPLFGQRDYARGAGKLPENPTFIMADPALDLVLEKSDPEGVYTIVGQVTDLVTGKKTDNFYKITFYQKRVITMHCSRQPGPCRSGKIEGY